MFKFLTDVAIDVAGFFAGTAMGIILAFAFDLQVFPDGEEAGSLIAIIMVGLCGGFGLQGARMWRHKKWPDAKTPQ
jgi:hypothetical protein